MSESYWNKRPGAETTKVFSPSISSGQDLLTVNKQLAVPLIDSINTENIHFRYQQEVISKQLEKLAVLVNTLLSENERLRSHYYQRNHDVQNLINSIKINIGCQINDIQHQIHLLRQANCQIFKNIQEQSKHTQQYEQRINLISKNLTQIKNDNTELQIKVGNMQEVRAKNKFNPSYVSKLSKKLQTLTGSEDSLLKQTTNLVETVSKLQKQNIGGIRKTNDQNYENIMDKKDYKQNIINALKSVTQLKRQKNQLQDFLKKNSDNLQILKDQYRISGEKLEKKTIQKQKIAQKMNKKLYERQRLVEQIQKSKKDFEKGQIQQMKKDEQRNKLQKQVIQKRRNLNNLKSQFQSQREQIIQSMNKQVQGLKQKIEQAESANQMQMVGLKKQLKGQSNLIEQLTLQLQQLNRDYNDYLGIQQKFNNPVQEIQRAQMRLRFRTKRNPLDIIRRNL